ncbi:hypothetical protein VMCG_04247 [Cytospora schulzeri]|uniref:Uncharacterized protein n=1 Tax=Cytospora schulzeri TaxID=448051 RepID=A0A423WTI4_9PEZI|nr:hypothetical protein VMCG_04247 [Valsa malicola]
MASTSPTATPKPANKMRNADLEDDALDREWKPNGRRPQSTIARSFSLELQDIFRIDDSITELDTKLEERKQNVQTRASELEALERRIKEMEERLKRNGKNPAPQTTIPQRQQSVAQQMAQADQKHGGSRPGTAKASQQAVPGALPPTPTASEGEYEILTEDPYTSAFGPEYPRFRHPHLVPRMTTTSGSGGGAEAGGVLHQAQQLRSHYQYQNSPTTSLTYHLSVNKNSDARSVRSIRTTGSENGSADFVIVPGPDGDGEQAH